MPEQDLTTEVTNHQQRSRGNPFQNAEQLSCDAREVNQKKH